MLGRNRRSERQETTRAAGRYLRQLRIGPRLFLFLAIPSLALLLMIGLVVSSDVRSLQELRGYAESIERINEQVAVRGAIQQERNSVLPSTDQSSMPEDELDLAIFQLGFVGGSSFTEDLDTARDLASSDPAQSASLYTDLINSLGGDIDDALDSAPLGTADQRSAAFRALLAAQELLLLEGLETHRVEPNPIRLTELHTTALSELRQFGDLGSTEGVARAELLMASDFWQELDRLRAESFATATTDGFDRSIWDSPLNTRNAELASLVATETQNLRRDVDEVISSEFQRLLLLAVAAVLVVAFAIAAVLQLRRSIVAPLSALKANAQSLSRGEPASTGDDALDEVGEVSRAFTSISGTMEQLWNDVDAVSEAVADGEYDQRIKTDHLSGDWLRLAETMNTTLATGEEHRVIIREELDRRGARAEISNAVALASTPAELTSAVLKHLPASLEGSHAHLHVHPSGPPLFDLAIPLEPSISALELPTSTDRAQLVRLRRGQGIASLVPFSAGPPAVLVLAFGYTKPTQIEPLVSLVETAAQILAQAHLRQAAESKVVHEREHDLLTNLPNSEYARHWFNERADRSVPWSIIGIQPQRLDEFDGRMGRASRDLLMKVIAEALAGVIAKEVPDQASEIELVRLSDPDFAIITPTSVRTDLSSALAAQFRLPVFVDGQEVELGATIAYDEISLIDRDLTQAISNVTAAIAQAEGRETEVIAFVKQHRESLSRRGIIGSWLLHAIENNELTVAFQPIVNAITTSTEGYELLVRGKMDGQPLSPEEFIPVAEDNGMITEIGRFVLREACAALPFLQGSKPYVAVNLSPVQLSDDDLLNDIEGILAQARVRRDRVIFEVTEGATATPEALERLSEIRDLGVKIAIDDFGSGQSNLAYLNDLPAEILKLDRSLVTPIEDDEGAATLVQKTIEMAHALGMTVVGEGVETNEQLDALRRVYCDRIQGWLTGKPAPLEQFIEISVDKSPNRAVARDNT